MSVPMTATRTRHPRLVAALLLIALPASLGLGCAFGEIRPGDPFKRKYTLQLAQHDYTNYVRWNEKERASGFIDPDLREEYRAAFPDRRDIRFTDFESGPVELDDEKKTSTIRVTYLAYPTASPIEIEVTETQEWYRDKVTNNWQVRSSFEGLEEHLAQRGER